MWSFDKIITHRERFKPIVARLNKLIGRDAFTDGLLQVGLLASVPTDEDEEPGTPGTSSEAASPMEVDNEETSDEIIPPLPVKRVKQDFATFSLSIYHLGYLSMAADL